MKGYAVAVCTLSLASGLADAAIIFNDGGEHSIESELGDIRLTLGTTVSVGANGVIRGEGLVSGTPQAFAAAAAFVPNQTGELRVASNGRIEGGADQYGIVRTGTGRVRLGGDSFVSGGRVDDVVMRATGFSEPPNPDLITFLTDRALVDGHMHVDGHVFIAEHARVNGNLWEASGGLSLDMSGGTVAGSVGTGSFVNHVGHITGGTILGQYGRGVSNVADFEMHGGHLAGGWALQANQLDAQVYGGRIDGGMSFQLSPVFASASYLSIFGGELNAASGGWLIDWSQGDFPSGVPIFLDLWGGRLGYDNAGSGIRLTGLANLDVYGFGLSLTGDRLTGQLSDGSFIDTLLTYNSNWIGQVRLHDVSVPEPGTLALFSLGLLGMGIARRRGRKR